MSVPLTQALGPVFEFVANCIDRPLGRITIGLIAIAVTAFLGTASIVSAATLTNGLSLMGLVGLGGSLGIIGGWVRVLATTSVLSRSRLLRWCAVIALTAGTATSGALLLGSTMLNAWSPLSGMLFGLGVLLLAGTIASFRPQSVRLLR